MKSLKELFRIGYGPSSSHTMGPARAAEQFAVRYPDADHYEVTLYGSLAATGRGHMTDRAIFNALPEEKTKIIWKPDETLPPHPNGMHFIAFDAQNKSVGERICFSIGGGAVSEDGSAENSPEVYPYKNMREIVDFCMHEGIPIWQLAERHESPDIWKFLSMVVNQMEATLLKGLSEEGVLPGGLRLARKARTVLLKAQALRHDIRRTGLISAGAYAVSEENASLGMVVTAPTCGSCGVVPAILHYFKEENQLSHQELIHALATAGIVGNVVKQNGSISGAEVGCQGEVGVACSMAAAAAAQIFGATVPQIEYAAEIGLEHFLGLTCDPIHELVQVPCIERNALAANRAVVAAEMAFLSDGNHVVSFDDVIKTMLETGHDLPSLYRETSRGGLSKIVKI